MDTEDKTTEQPIPREPKPGDVTIGVPTGFIRVVTTPNPPPEPPKAT
jgi:hypothetical protein